MNKNLKLSELVFFYKFNFKLSVFNKMVSGVKRSVRDKFSLIINNEKKILLHRNDKNPYMLASDVKIRKHFSCLKFIKEERQLSHGDAVRF